MTIVAAASNSSDLQSRHVILPNGVHQVHVIVFQNSAKSSRAHSVVKYRVNQRFLWCNLSHSRCKERRWNNAFAFLRNDQGLVRWNLSIQSTITTPNQVSECANQPPNTHAWQENYDHWKLNFSTLHPVWFIHIHWQQPVQDTLRIEIETICLKQQQQQQRDIILFVPVDQPQQFLQRARPIVFTLIWVRTWLLCLQPQRGSHHRSFVPQSGDRLCGTWHLSSYQIHTSCKHTQRNSAPRSRVKLWTLSSPFVLKGTLDVFSW